MANRVPISDKPSVPYQNVSFYSYPDNVLLKGWYFPALGNNIVIVMHGGKQNRSQSGIGLIKLCTTLNRRGYGILTFDRRQCGESESPNLRVRARLDRDLAGAIKFIRNKVGTKTNIYLWGTSIGAVAALSCAVKVDGIKAIVADSCFADIPEMISRQLIRTFPVFIIFKPGSMFMGKQFFGMERNRLIDNVGQITCPILFVNGTGDLTIPKEDTYRLYIASQNPASQIWIVNGADHSKCYLTNPEVYVDKIISFFKMSEVSKKEVKYN
ncbi:MAG: alpha/beta hydrolase [Dehalococcoidia bacterium]|nr:MAG: alpha/beta hydrolase [Dehalococcoidia bacterium]